MARNEVCGKTDYELEQLREEFEEWPLHQEHGIEFETLYCLANISAQPEDYDGPDRYCSKFVPRISEEMWEQEWDDEFDYHDPRAFYSTCKCHGKTWVGRGNPSDLDGERKTAAITHGMRSEDEHLKMDFDEDEQNLYDAIVETWPEAYDWPPEEEDPARYIILEKVAVNFVRSNRAEEILDNEGELVDVEQYNEQGIAVGEVQEENPISKEYRLLTREIVQMMKELGLTPKEQVKQGAAESQGNAMEEIGEALGEAVVGSDEDYDPGQFEDEDDDE